jgi:hypothetical protein
MRDDIWIRHEARVSGEHAVHVRPDLNLARTETGTDDRRGIIRSPASECRRDAVFGRADKAAHHRNTTRGKRRIDVGHQRRSCFGEQRRGDGELAVSDNGAARVDPRREQSL